MIVTYPNNYNEPRHIICPPHATQKKATTLDRWAKIRYLECIKIWLSRRYFFWVIDHCCRRLCKHSKQVATTSWEINFFLVFEGQKMNMPHLQRINVESFAKKKSVLAFRQWNRKAKTRLKITTFGGSQTLGGGCKAEFSDFVVLCLQNWFFSRGVSETQWWNQCDLNGKHNRGVNQAIHQTWRCFEIFPRQLKEFFQIPGWEKKQSKNLWDAVSTSLMRPISIEIDRRTQTPCPPSQLSAPCTIRGRFLPKPPHAASWPTTKNRPGQKSYQLKKTQVVVTFQLRPCRDTRTTSCRGIYLGIHITTSIEKVLPTTPHNFPRG